MSDYEYIIQSQDTIGGQWNAVSPYDTPTTSKTEVEEWYYKLVSEQTGDFYDDIRVSSVRDAQRIVDRHDAVKNITYRIAARPTSGWFDPMSDGTWWE